MFSSLVEGGWDRKKELKKVVYYYLFVLHYLFLYFLGIGPIKWARGSCALKCSTAAHPENKRESAA